MEPELKGVGLKLGRDTLVDLGDGLLEMSAFGLRSGLQAIQHNKQKSISPSIFISVLIL